MKLNDVNSLLYDDSRTGRRGSSGSSLDYRYKNDGSATTTKPTKRKNPQQQQQHQQNNQQQGPSYSTRARGSSGPPPRKYDLSQIETMDEYQLIQAIREDPEFAAAAAKYTNQAIKESENQAPTTKPTGAKKARQDGYYRSSDGNAKDITEYPEHIRELMDSGVPVTQWVVLLLILGAIVFQMRKVLIGPEKKKPALASANRNKTRGKESNSKGKQKKQKKRPEAAKSSNEAKEKPPTSIISKTIEKPKATKTALPTDSQQKAKKKKKKSKNGASKKEMKPLPDVVSSDGSTTINQDEGESDKSTAPPSLAQTILPIDTEPELEDDDGGWLTVTKSRGATIQNTSEGKNDSSSNVSQSVASPEKKTIHVEEVSQGSTKQMRVNDDDAALARMLQNEEETLAKEESGSGTESAWEEVTKKKRK